MSDLLDVPAPICLSSVVFDQAVEAAPKPTACPFVLPHHYGSHHPAAPVPYETTPEFALAEVRATLDWFVDEVEVGDTALNFWVTRLGKAYLILSDLIQPEVIPYNAGGCSAGGGCLGGNCAVPPIAPVSA